MKPVPQAFCALLALWCAACPATQRAHEPPRPALRAEVVDDATLAGLSGRYYGANLLVGVRVHLVSTLNTPNGSATATARLDLQRVGGGYSVRIDTQSQASAGDGAASAGTHAATGAGGLQVDGIGQVSQIAGDGNSMTNLTTIQLTPAGPTGDAATYNGQSSSNASAGAMTAHISFDGNALQLGLAGPGVQIGQHVGTGSGGLLQVGQIAADGVTAYNRMQLQPLLGAMPTATLHQLGVQQALAGLAGVGR